MLSDDRTTLFLLQEKGCFYILIFGHDFLPEPGAKGSATATVSARLIE